MTTYLIKTVTSRIAKITAVVSIAMLTSACSQGPSLRSELNNTYGSATRAQAVRSEMIQSSYRNESRAGFATHKPAQARRSKIATYRVRKGDTLYSIARQHGTKVHVLARHNTIAKAAFIRVGQVIKIPR